MADIVERFATSPKRIELLKGLLAYRSDLRAIGITKGFQWIDGSFVEDVENDRGRPPNDVDIVTFVSAELCSIANQSLRDPANASLLDRDASKAKYRCDVFYVRLDNSPEQLIRRTAFFLSLFSHNKELPEVWKGMLSVSLETKDNDADAGALLASKVVSS